jgi:hypothetical protein
MVEKMKITEIKDKMKRMRVVIAAAIAKWSAVSDDVLLKAYCNTLSTKPEVGDPDYTYLINELDKRNMWTSGKGCLNARGVRLCAALGIVNHTVRL